MIKKEYDAIVIGGGIQGLCLGAYLQRAGMQTAIFERRHEEGGCVCTRETTAPGFMHNHAVCMEFLDWMPFYHDFGLQRLGGRTIYPDAQFGIPFSDGTTSGPTSRSPSIRRRMPTRGCGSAGRPRNWNRYFANSFTIPPPCPPQPIRILSRPCTAPSSTCSGSPINWPRVPKP